MEALPAFFAELAAWADAHAVPVERRAYGDQDDQWLELRRPDGEPRGLALVLHGGFWRPGFTLATTRALAIALTRAGWTTANAEYRRPGPGGFGPMLEDVRAAAAALGRSAVALGHSAGGHLALYLAARGDAAAAVGLGAVCDLKAAEAAELGAGAVRELLGGGPAEVPDAYAEADPARRLPLGAGHVLVHAAADDRVPLEHARRYAERARAAGDDCRLVVVEDADHFDPIDPRSAAWPAVLAALESLEPAHAV